MDKSTVNIAKIVADAAEDKKGDRIVTLDIQGLSVIADYFVICNGNSEVQVQAIAKEIKDKLEESGITVRGFEGFDSARWILIDAGDVVAHVFHKEERDFYNIERVWGDAKIVSSF